MSRGRSPQYPLFRPELRPPGAPRNMPLHRTLLAMAMRSLMVRDVACWTLTLHRLLQPQCCVSTRHVSLDHLILVRGNMSIDRTWNQNPDRLVQGNAGDLARRGVFGTEQLTTQPIKHRPLAAPLLHYILCSCAHASAFLRPRVRTICPIARRTLGPGFAGTAHPARLTLAFDDSDPRPGLSDPILYMLALCTKRRLFGAAGIAAPLESKSTIPAFNTSSTNTEYHIVAFTRGGSYLELSLSPHPRHLSIGTLIIWRLMFPTWVYTV